MILFQYRLKYAELFLNYKCRCLVEKERAVSGTTGRVTVTVTLRAALPRRSPCPRICTCLEGSAAVKWNVFSAFAAAEDGVRLQLG